MTDFLDDERVGEISIAGMSTALIVIGAGYILSKVSPTISEWQTVLQLIGAPVWCIIAILNFRFSKIGFKRQVFLLVWGVPLLWDTGYTLLIMLTWAIGGFAP